MLIGADYTLEVCVYRRDLRGGLGAVQLQSRSSVRCCQMAVLVLPISIAKIFT